MKKQSIYFLVIIILLVQTSCQQNNEEEDFFNNQITLLENNPRLYLSKIDSTQVTNLNNSKEATHFLLVSLANYYVNNYYPPKEVLQKSIHIFTKKKLIQQQLESLLFLAKTYKKEKNLKMEVQAIEKAIDIASQIEDKEWLCCLYGYLGDMYIRKYNMLKFIKYQTLANQCIEDIAFRDMDISTQVQTAKSFLYIYLLQIRPMVDVKANLEEDLNLIKDKDVLLKSNNSLGHGIMEDIQDVIYVKTDGYTASNNPTIAYEIEKMNRKFLDEGKHYILVGPGRWGSSDSWLGIPVKWPHISAARVIVEAGLTNYRVDPSQGTHFFQNLTSFGVGYFTINAYMKDGIYNQEVLDTRPAIEETRFIRHVRFDKPLIVKMDGKKKLGVVMLPE